MDGVHTHMGHNKGWPKHTCAYTVYVRYFLQGNYCTYGHIRCTYTVLANLSHNPVYCNTHWVWENTWVEYIHTWTCAHHSTARMCSPQHSTEVLTTAQHGGAHHIANTDLLTTAQHGGAQHSKEVLTTSQTRRCSPHAPEHACTGVHPLNIHSPNLHPTYL